MKWASLVAGVGIDHAAEPQRLVGEDADGPAAEPREGRDHVAGIGRLDLEDAVLVGQQRDDLAHVVGLARRWTARGRAGLRRGAPGDRSRRAPAGAARALPGR